MNCNELQLLDELTQVANNFRGLRVEDPCLKAGIEMQIHVLQECWAAVPEPVKDLPQEPKTLKDFVEDLQQGIRSAAALQRRLSPEELARLYPEHAKVIKHRDLMWTLQSFWLFLHNEDMAKWLNEFEIERICGKFLEIDIVEYRDEHVRMVEATKEKPCVTESSSSAPQPPTSET